MAAPITAVDPAPAPLRHELKFPLAPGEDLELARRLARLFPRDSHAGPGGSYRVTSLYFDTPSDRALREKVEGTGRREKFRLRYYGEDTGRLRLEKKFKVGSLCGKRGAPLGREEALRLLGGNWGWLLDPGEPLFVELYSKLRGQLLRPASGNLDFARLDQTQRSGRRLRRQLPRQQKIAGIARRDMDFFPGKTEVLDIIEEDQFHVSHILFSSFCN